MIEEKQLLLDEVKEQISASSSFVIMRYMGLKANKVAEFRRKVAGLGGSVGVMRKRILIKAAEAAGIELDSIDLAGHIGLVYSNGDPAEIAKCVFTFGEDNDKCVAIAGGYIDGQLYKAAEVVTLSQLPSRDELRAQFLSLLEAPMAQTLAVVDALLTSVIHCMDNKCEAEKNENSANSNSEEIHV